MICYADAFSYAKQSNNSWYVVTTVSQVRRNPKVHEKNIYLFSSFILINKMQKIRRVKSVAASLKTRKKKQVYTLPFTLRKVSGHRITK